jgi:endonuclease I
MKKIITLILISGLPWATVRAGTVPPDSTIFPGQTGTALIASLVSAYKSTSNLGYDAGRDTLYGVIDKINDSLECVYSSYRIWMDPTQDPSTWAYSHDFNCEHSWPQSLIYSSTAVADLHHLYPTDIEVNGARDNDPFSDIPDAQTITWYYNNTTSSSIPSSNIDLYAEEAPGTFEPREQQKGNTARSMYYMLTMWQLSDTNLAWWTGQKNTLYAWHVNDPADAREIARTRKIATYQQGKVNPYVLDSTLIRRAFFPTTSSNTTLNFASTSITRNEGDGLAVLTVTIANPSGSAATTVDVVLTGGTGTAADIGGYVTKTLTFPAGSSASRSDTVTITNDTIEEGTETLVFRLRNVAGGSSAAAGSDSVLTLTLTDNDDATAPVITSGPTATGITSSSATIAWTTNEIANSWVYYGLTTAYSDTFRNETDVSAHSIGLSGLAASTTYHYKVSSTDPMDNGPTYSGDNTFTTASVSSGDSLLFEPFDYPAGDSINGIHNWVLHSGTTNPIRVVAPGLGYTGYKSSTNACSLFVTGEDVNRAFPSQSSGTIYSSFLVKVDSATTTGDYFFHLSAASLSTTYFVGRVYVRKDASNNLAFGLAKSSEGATYSGFSYALKTTYVLVLKYKIGPGAADDTVSLFVINGPLPASEPSSPSVGPIGSANADPSAIGTVALRQGGSTTGPIIKLDDIKIGTSWSKAPLGVELAYFTALGEPGSISLKWTTSSELNSWQWRIFSSADSATGYRHRASLPTTGTTNEVREYGWSDREAVPGIRNYYRLVEMDVAGDSAVYGPVSAMALPEIKTGSHQWVFCSPNPFCQTISINYHLDKPENAKLEIYNVFGQKIRSMAGIGRAGHNTFFWDGKTGTGQNCPAGIYIFRMTAGGKGYNGKITLIK